MDWQDYRINRGGKPTPKLRNFIKVEDPSKKLAKLKMEMAALCKRRKIRLEINAKPIACSTKIRKLSIPTSGMGKAPRS